MLCLLRCLFEVPGLKLGPAAAYSPALLAPLTALLDGPNSSAALQVHCNASLLPLRICVLGNLHVLIMQR